MHRMMLTISADEHDANSVPSIHLSHEFLTEPAVIQMMRLLDVIAELMAMAEAIDKTHAPLRCTHCR